MRTEEEKDFASTTAYIYAHLRDTAFGFLDSIDDVMATADAFLKEYPTGTDWEKTESDWESTLYYFNKRFNENR